MVRPSAINPGSVDDVLETVTVLSDLVSEVFANSVLVTGVIGADTWFDRVVGISGPVLVMVDLVSDALKDSLLEVGGTVEAGVDSVEKVEDRSFEAMKLEIRAVTAGVMLLPQGGNAASEG